MYSLSYSTVCLHHVNKRTSSRWESHHEMISMPPPINRGYHDCGWSNAGLRRSHFLQTIFRGGLSSRQQSWSHCRFPAAPLPWPPENENTFENGTAFKVNLRVVGFRRLLLPFESSPLPSPPARKALVESVNSNQSAYTEIGQTVTRTHKLPT